MCLAACISAQQQAFVVLASKYLFLMELAQGTLPFSLLLMGRGKMCITACISPQQQAFVVQASKYLFVL